ncbi:hypothetical protein [Segniliparus rugosus]|uniref:hypothetical protein n=1 Tax=Segniliparus rugosus TaxID=286804 RepID=UPI0012EBFF48|nr:hypothetical protein [Segniliparus rugosus]
MIVRSPLLVGAVVALTASFGLAGCNRGGTPGASTSNNAAPSSSQAPATLDAAAVKTASCAVFNKAIAKAQTANDAFGHAVQDPKRPHGQWNKPMSDAADNAAVILAYVAKDVEDNAIKPQLAPDLADKFKQFVQITRERVTLYGKHAGGDEIDGNAKPYDDISNQLIKICK